MVSGAFSSRQLAQIAVVRECVHLWSKPSQCLCRTVELKRNSDTKPPLTASRVQKQDEQFARPPKHRPMRLLSHPGSPLPTCNEQPAASPVHS